MFLLAEAIFFRCNL